MELRRKLEAHGPRLIHTVRGARLHVRRRGRRVGRMPPLLPALPYLVGRSEDHAMRMSLTTRLTAFFLGALALVLAGFSAALFLLARSASIARRTTVWRRP